MSNKVVGFVSKLDQRKMADRIGDADNFRSAKRVTDNGVVTMRTQGRLRSRFDLEEDERKRVAVPVPTLTEIDLSGAATQADRLYYHSDPQDELRIWSSDGLLSMAVTPLRRIIFKTSAIDPAKTISLWPMQEDEDGALTAPDVVADGNPAAVEIARTYHDEVYVYPRNDALVDYSTLLGLGFALTRIKTMNATLEGIQYSFEFSGFDQAGAAVVSASVPACPVAIEPVFSKRKYDTGGVKSISGKPYSVKVAPPGGVLPFAKHAALLQAKEHSGDAAIVRPIADLCRVTAFGQPWHGYCEIGAEKTRVWDSHTKDNLLLELPRSISGNSPKPAIFGSVPIAFDMVRYNVQLTVQGTELTEIELSKKAVFANGSYSPIGGPSVSSWGDNRLGCLYKDGNGSVWEIEFVRQSNTSPIMTVIAKSRFDDFLAQDNRGIDTVIGNFSLANSSLSSRLYIAIVPAEDAKSCAVICYGGASGVNRHGISNFGAIVVSFEGNGYIGDGGVISGISSSISTTFSGVGNNLQVIQEGAGVFTDSSHSITTNVQGHHFSDSDSMSWFYEQDWFDNGAVDGGPPVDILVYEEERTVNWNLARPHIYIEGSKHLADVAWIDGKFEPIYSFYGREVTSSFSGQNGVSRIRRRAIIQINTAVPFKYAQIYDDAVECTLSDNSISLTERVMCGYFVGDVFYGAEQENSETRISNIIVIGNFGRYDYVPAPNYKYLPIGREFPYSPEKMNNPPIDFYQLVNLKTIRLSIPSVRLSTPFDTRYHVAFIVEGGVAIHDGVVIHSPTYESTKLIYDSFNKIGHVVNSEISGFYF